MDEVKAELKVRRRLENIFNKRQDEFESKKAYDDYLEMREEYIFNLALNMDVVDTEGKIAEYQRMNHENIIMNRARQMDAISRASDTVLELPAMQDETVAPAGPAVAETTTVYVPSASMASAGATVALPVPMHTEYSEDKDGNCILAPHRRNKKHWRQVAAASGWDPASGLSKALVETMKCLF